jgi:uncharacterized protein (TIGR03435 family)
MRTIQASVAFSLAIASTFALGQSASPVPTPEKPKQLAFDIVSVRPSRPATYPGANGGASVTWAIEPDGYRASNQTIWSTIMIAYFPQGMASWTPDRLKGAPSWLDSEQYDIEAKVSAEDLPAWQRQGSSLERQEMFRTMLRSLLADRCKLAVHRISNEVSGLILEVGKRGPQFKPTASDETIPSGGMRTPEGGTVLNEEEGRTIRFYGVTMERLAWYLSTFSYPRLTVEDQTGLSGRYDLVLHRPSPLPGEDDTSSTLSWDLKPLGLEFRQIKIPMDTIVIDHVERPSQN